jgi:hypothetical protein
MITSPESIGGENFMSGWSNHVDGATKLLELRGMEQMEFPAGRALFTLVRMQVVRTLTTDPPCCPTYDTDN